MTKTDAMEILGCTTIIQLADGLRLTPGTVEAWPEQLTDAQADRVQRRAQVRRSWKRGSKSGSRVGR